MIGLPTLIDSPELDDMLSEALDLPINQWITKSNVGVKAYYTPDIVRGDYSTIRVATDVERQLLTVDAIIVVSYTGTVSFTHKDMMVLLSDMLNMIDPVYGGSDDAPAIFIKQQTYRLNPTVVNYFGIFNKVTGEIFDKISPKSYELTYEDKMEEITGLYTRNTDVPAGGDSLPAGRYSRM